MQTFESFSPEEQAKAKLTLDNWFEENYDQLIENFSQDIIISLDRKNNEFVAEIQSEIDEFQSRLFDTWKAPLIRFSSLIAMCMEVGDEINRDYRVSGRYTTSSRRDTTLRIHARAVQVANEISCLARGGYADGAIGRWRSLHEASVILAILSRGDETLSDRFIDHQVVGRFKAATEYNKHHAELDFEAFDPTELADMQKASEAMLHKYGKQFSSEFGWASETLNLKRPLFKDIEEHVALSFLRPHYGFASKNIHSGVDSIGYKLALSMTQKDILLTGPSNEGLLDPIQLASYSIIFATVELINTMPDENRAIMQNVLWKWHEMLIVELVEAEEALRSSGSDDK